jgi:HTH-type transcriptional regulator/antitoxin HigA
MPRVAANSAKKLPGDFDALVRRMPPSAIRDRVDYVNTQEMIDALTCVPKLTKGQERYLDTLSVLMEAYEREHEEIDTSRLSPLDMLRFLLSENDMSASDLGRLLGERSLGPKILNGHRELSKSHIRVLAERFKARADLFL